MQQGAGISAREVVTASLLHLGVRPCIAILIGRIVGVSIGVAMLDGGFFIDLVSSAEDEPATVMSDNTCSTEEAS